MKNLFLFTLLLFGLQFFIRNEVAAINMPLTEQTDSLQSDDDVVFVEIEEAGVEENTVSSTATDSASVQKTPLETSSTSNSSSMWVIFLLGLGGGFLAFLMPCIYPMVPLTVSFFTKRAETKGKGIQGAILYGLSIIIIYVSIGLIITLVWGASALNQLSTDAYFNIFIFLVLMIFGISFLGAFELTLPSKFVNKLDEKSDSKGLTGIFFMAATLTVVSFSCTGPIIGGVLVTIENDIWAPIIAMFGFSLALAIIFTVFAIFPSWLTTLPKSGGWLNSVKVVLGFLEIALAMKFLSTADLVYHWGILDREVFLAIWIVIAFLIGFYLLGKLKFSHDSDLKFISIPRLFFAIIAFSFGVFMIPGLWGAPLKVISGLLPPMHTQDYVVLNGGSEGASADKTKKYSEIAEIPHGIDGFFDYDEALAYAKTVNKPLLLDFTGHGCVNCREMEQRVWPDPRVLKLLKDEYIVVSLYTDDRTALPESEHFYSDILKKNVNTIGRKFMHLQATRFQTIAQPYYVLMDVNEELLVSPPIGAEFNIENYLAYLQKGLDEFSKK